MPVGRRQRIYAARREYLDTLCLREFVWGDHGNEFVDNSAIFQLQYYIVFHKLCFQDGQSMLNLLLLRKSSREGKLEPVLEVGKLVASGGDFWSDVS